MIVPGFSFALTKLVCLYFCLPLSLCICVSLLLCPLCLSVSLPLESLVHIVKYWLRSRPRKWLSKRAFPCNCRFQNSLRQRDRRTERQTGRDREREAAFRRQQTYRSCEGQRDTDRQTDTNTQTDTHTHTNRRTYRETNIGKWADKHKYIRRQFLPTLPRGEEITQLQRDYPATKRLPSYKESLQRDYQVTKR